MNKITKEQKIAFFQFCLDIYTKTDEELDVIWASGKLGNLSSQRRPNFLSHEKSWVLPVISRVF